MEKLYYTYILLRPDGSTFYIGEGSGNRFLQHEKDALKGCTGEKCDEIRRIWAEGGKVTRWIVHYSTSKEDNVAYQDMLLLLYGLENITNTHPGRWGKGTYNPKYYGRSRPGRRSSKGAVERMFETWWERAPELSFKTFVREIYPRYSGELQMSDDMVSYFDRNYVNVRGRRHYQLNRMKYAWESKKNLPHWPDSVYGT